MTSREVPEVEDVIDQPCKIQFEAFLDQHRVVLGSCLEGLSEDQARRRASRLTPRRSMTLKIHRSADSAGYQQLRNTRERPAKPGMIGVLSWAPAKRGSPAYRHIASPEKGVLQEDWERWEQPTRG